jgi:peptide/nickel transport system ATP-binding protein
MFEACTDLAFPQRLISALRAGRGRGRGQARAAVGLPRHRLGPGVLRPRPARGRSCRPDRRTGAPRGGLARPLGSLPALPAHARTTRSGSPTAPDRGEDRGGLGARGCGRSMTDMLLEVEDLQVVFHGPRRRNTHAVDGVDFLSAAGAPSASSGNRVAARASRHWPSWGSCRRRARRFRRSPVRGPRSPEGAEGRHARSARQPTGDDLPGADDLSQSVLHRWRPDRGGHRAPPRHGPRAARLRAIEMLRRVRIPEPEARFDDYPHRLSGGMRQRVMIAMALACDPQLLIADEPTTALDVTIQAQILDLMRKLREDSNAAIILITHDLGVVAEVCDEVVVMYAGQVVERAPVEVLFRFPQHPYTVGLLGSLPRLDAHREELAAIEGTVPDMSSRLAGCRFEARCPFRVERCGPCRRWPWWKESICRAAGAHHWRNWWHEPARDGSRGRRSCQAIRCGALPLRPATRHSEGRRRRILLLAGRRDVGTGG